MKSFGIWIITLTLPSKCTSQQINVFPCETVTEYSHWTYIFKSVETALSPRTLSSHHARPTCGMDFRLFSNQILLLSHKAKTLPWTLAIQSLPSSSFSITQLFPKPPHHHHSNLYLNRKFAQISTSIFGWLGVFVISGYSQDQFSAHQSPCSHSLPEVLKSVQARASLSNVSVWDWPATHVGTMSASQWPRILGCPCSGFSISDASLQLINARAPSGGEIESYSGPRLRRTNTWYV